MNKLKTLAVCIGVSALGITACHDDDVAKPPVAATKTVNVTPSLGKITKGRVALKNALTKQAISDIKTIGTDGTVSFTVEASKLVDPIIAEVLPTVDGKLEYADEAIPKQLVTIDASANTAILRAATTITANTTNLGVTALTEAAVSYAETLNAQLSKANIDTANQKITDQLKLSKFKITDAPAIIGLNDFSPLINTALAEQQRAYAAYLATLAKESKRLHATSTQPAYDIAKAFSKDFTDGLFDGKQGQTILTDYTTSFIQAWVKWVETFYASIFNLKTSDDLNAWLNAFNAEQPNIPTPSTPVVPVTESCTSKKLPIATLTSIADFSGDYKKNGTVVLNLSTSTAKAIVKGTTTADIKEVCGPTNLSNGTSYYVITDKGYINLFKDTASKYTSESADFSGFDGEKATTTPTPALCESNGADDKLGFKNAPSDFCGFIKASSIAITSPDIYTFENTNKKQNVKVTVEGTTVKSVFIENENYSWNCGAASTIACSGVTFTSANNYKQIGFNNTVLNVVYGTDQPLTIKNGLLIHFANTSTPPATTNPSTPAVPATFNSAACQPDGNTYIRCQGNVTEDFEINNLKYYSTSNVAAGGKSSCVIKKSGNRLSITVDGKVTEAFFNGDLHDDLFFNRTIQSTTLRAETPMLITSAGVTQATTISLVFNSANQIDDVMVVHDSDSFVCR